MTITVRKTASGHPKLTWEAVPGAETYHIFRAKAPDAQFIRKFTTSNCSYLNTDALADATYYYKIQPIFADGQAGDFSRTVSSNPDWTDPAPDSVLAFRA